MHSFKLFFVNISILCIHLYPPLSRNPNIASTSNSVEDSEVDFEEPLCLGEAEDFEDDEDCDLPLELLRLVQHEEKQILPHQEDLETINLGTSKEIKEIKIDTTISSDTHSDLISLLQEFKDIFAWSYQDMPGLNTEIVVHRLPLRTECKPVQQKLRRMKPDMLLKIKDKVKRQFDAGSCK